MKNEKNNILTDLQQNIKKLQRDCKLSQEALKQSNKVVAKYDKSMLLLKQKNALLNRLQKTAKIGIWELDITQNKLSWSDEVYRIFGFSSDVRPNYELFLKSIHPDDVKKVNHAYEQSLQNKQPYAITHRIVLNGGEVKYLHEKCITIFNEDGEAVLSSGTVQDITKRKEAEIALKEQYNYLQSIIDSVHDPIMVIKENFTVEIMNNAVRKKMESFNIVDRDKLKCYEISHNRTTPCDGAKHPCPLHNVMRTKQHASVVHKRNHKDGSIYYVDISATPLLDKEQNCVGIIEIYRDVTSYVEVQNRLLNEKKLLNQQAHYDELTKLPNRLLLNDRLLHAIKKANRNHTKIAVLFIDLDHFKEINDSLGHEMGDKVLKVVAQRLNKTIREEDTLARLGGDEFIVVIEGLTKALDMSSLIQKVVDILVKPIEIDENTLHISSSIGISIYPDDGDSIQSLLKYADIAMYKAKDRGRNNFQYFSS